MGVVYYGGGETPIHIEDRVLAHLKVVIATKLRRNESFTLSFRHGPFDPVGRTTIWLHPAIPLRFEFEEPEAPELDPQLIRDLANSANTSGGIALKPEHILRASVWRPEAALASEAGAAPVAPADGPNGAAR
jgi:hypothetical protein